MKRTLLLLSASILFFLSCLPAWSELPVSVQAKMGSLSGQIFVDDHPQALVLVSLFLVKNGQPPVTGGMRRVPEYLSRTDAAGKFKLNLAAGDYYLGLLDRAPGASPGPPRPGEIFHFAADEVGNLLVLSVAGQQHLKAGRINGVNPENFSDSAKSFTVKGMVRSETGDPVANVAVLGKSQLNIPRPEFISDRTGEDGRFSLKLPADRAYYLVAREDIAASRPQPGSYVGTYGIHSKTGLATLSMFSAGSPPPGVQARDEESRAQTIVGSHGEIISDIDIFMYQVPDPEVIKQSVQGNIELPESDQDMQIKYVLFPKLSSDLDEMSHQELNRWISLLGDLESIEIEVVGHADDGATAAANQLLSENRAMSVAGYMISAGVSPYRIKVSGVGDIKSSINNAGSEDPAQNRRVEIRFIKLSE